MIYPEDLKEMVIRPVLMAMTKNGWPHAYSHHAMNLLIGTFYQESTIAGNTHLKQVRGPALGPYQVEPSTMISMFVHNIRFRPERLQFLIGHLSRIELPDQDVALLTTDGSRPGARGVNVTSDVVGKSGMMNALFTNLDFATAIARHKYYTAKFTWPDDPNDIHALGVIWNKIYNANPDHGEPEDFVAKFPTEVLS